VIVGDVHLWPAVRTAYHEQVRRIAPVNLVGRDEELAALAAYCTAPGDGHYWWWRAPAWSGKSALLSWFVLHPPPEVLIVSFFVTARLASQNDRVAFTDAVLEQLADIAGQPMPAYLTEATRDAHLLRLLRETAEACRERGGRLVLVVDGLDEDRGVTGPAAHSIAGLLPVSPPAGLRVVVASRPHPPVPPDVPDHHPLRAPGTVRDLATSARASAVRADMERDLDLLLRGDDGFARDLLGLVVAAGGGLSGRDLAELTAEAPYDVIRRLNTVSGRSFARRAGRWRPGVDPDVYLLGHEDLQLAAATVLGTARLAGYRDRIHAWGDRHRREGWPVGTPEYLLRGYHRMLRAAGDTGRMVALVTDPARHDRMLDVTGGDAIALTEIIATHEALAAAKPPDLGAVVRLAVHRDRLTSRNASIPAELPAVWARLGQHARADNLAHSIRDPLARARALVEVAKVFAAFGESRSATVLVGQAEALARSLPGDQARAAALLDAVEGWAALGEASVAEATARSIDDPYQRLRALARLVVALAAGGDRQEASRVAEDSGMLARSAVGKFQRAAAATDLARALAAGWGRDAGVPAFLERTQRTTALVELAKVWSAVGQRERAARSAASAKRLLRGPSVHVPGWETETLVELAGIWATAGEPGRAETAAASITDPGRRAWALAGLAEVAAASGERDRAVRLASEAETLATAPPDADRPVSDRPGSARSLARAAGAWAALGEDERATELAEQATTLARSATDPRRRAEVLIRLAGALVGTGQRERAVRLAQQAERLAGSMTPFDRGGALADLVEVWASAGAFDHAETLARSTDDQRLVWALRNVARALGAAGEQQRAEALARSIDYPDPRARTLAELADVSAARGGQDAAIRLAEEAGRAAGTIIYSAQRIEALTAAAGAFSRAGRLERARRLAETAERQARSLPDEDERPWALTAVVDAWARIDADHAEEIANGLSGPDRQGAALTSLAAKAAAAGERDRATRLAQRIEELSRSVRGPHRDAILAGAASAWSGLGAHDRAEMAARSITDPDRRRSATLQLAEAHLAADQRDQALRALMEVLQTGDWTDSLVTVAKTEPTAAAIAADEYLNLFDGAASSPSDATVD
jgi:tetratricopeptide (TPR) repeat protein